MGARTPRLGSRLGAVARAAPVHLVIVHVLVQHRIEGEDVALRVLLEVHLDARLVDHQLPGPHAGRHRIELAALCLLRATPHPPSERPAEFTPQAPAHHFFASTGFTAS